LYETCSASHRKAPVEGGGRFYRKRYGGVRLKDYLNASDSDFGRMNPVIYGKQYGAGIRRCGSYVEYCG
jgi:hypothetical protein